MTREEAIYYLENTAWLGTDEDREKTEEAVNIAVALLQKPEQGWVPCSERMPVEEDVGISKKLWTEKRSEYVLATIEFKGERMVVKACTYDGEWTWGSKYALPDYEVTAWMPLPEPYAEKRENEI